MTMIMMMMIHSFYLFRRIFGFFNAIDTVCSVVLLVMVASSSSTFEKATMDDMGFGEPNQLPGLTRY